MSSSQLGDGQFAATLAEFVTKFNAESKEKWILHKSSDGIYAKQSVMVKWRDAFVNRQVHIAYNSTYSVPVLWFNIYKRDGTPLTSTEALEIASYRDNLDLTKNISQSEHPILGLLFYNVHPCTTTKIMDELNGEGNYIAKWLSVYGAPIGVSVPTSLFSSPPSTSDSEPVGALSTSETSRSSVSEEGSV